MRNQGEKIILYMNMFPVFVELCFELTVIMIISVN